MPIIIISTIDKQIVSIGNDINSILEGQIVCIAKATNKIYKENFSSKTYTTKLTTTIYVVEQP